MLCNVALLVGVALFIIRSNDSATVSIRQSAVVGANSSSDKAPTDPLDQLSSADIAVNVSRMAQLPETIAVTNQADSMAAELSAPPVDSIVVSKPQTVVTDLKSNKDIKEYVVRDGDTLASIAAQFNVTSDSISWSNSLANGKVIVGNTLFIPPVNGIVYTVKDGDTPDSLAQKYKADKDQIVLYNDAELTGLKAGERIIIPDGRQPAPVITRSYVTYSFGYGYNGYDYGFCTWYVANRRAQAGRPLPAGLGNASSWDNRAPAAGFRVDRTPEVGAAAVTSQSGAGHVVYVEVVNADGSIWVSEMNSHGQVSMTNTARAGGWGKVDWKFFPADKAATFSYIH